MATISFTTKFSLNTTPKKFIFVDTSDYAGQGIATANVNGCFKITSPSGVVIYNNTDFSNSNCDIRVSVSTTSQQTISLPLDGNGDVEAGLYTIEYSVYNNSTLETYTLTNTYTFDFTAPTVKITQISNCITPLFTSTDSTDYTVNETLPTIVRTHTLYYPNGSAGQGSPETGSAVTLTTSTFYNGTQTTTISSVLTYTFDDGLVVITTVTGVQEFVVDCTWICAIYCCIRSLEQQMETLRTTGSNDVLYRELTLKFAQVMGLVVLAKTAIECGKSDDVNDILTTIKDIANCTDDCSCDGDAPSLVTGLGGLVGPAGPAGAQGAPGANGSDGANGANGANGTTILDTYNDITGVTSPSSAVETPLYTFTTLANTLDAVGDEIEAYTRINVAAGIAATTVGIRFKLGGLSIYTDTVNTALNDSILLYKIKISKISNTSQLWTIERIDSDTISSITTDIITLSSAADTTTTNVFQVTAQGSGVGAGQATLYKTTLYKYSA